MTIDFENHRALNVLVTGAAGAIGTCLRAGLKGRYRLLRLMDRVPQSAAGPGEEVVTGDVLDLPLMETCMQGIDVVVHLAGIPGEDRWENIRDANIEGCFNLFEAARRQQVPRVVFASSNHAVGFYRTNQRIDAQVPVRPDTLYGVSKVFGEALGRLAADKRGMSVACLRIGSFRADDKPVEPRHLATWISHRDLVQLTTRCIEAASYHFFIVYGLSANTRAMWDNAGLEWLRYQPVDDAESHASALVIAEAGDSTIGAAFHGGSLCDIGFEGRADQIH